MSEARQLQWPMLDIRRCGKCGKYVPCMRCTAQGKDFELMLTVKMETRHPEEGQFVVNFKRSVIIADL